MSKSAYFGLKTTDFSGFCDFSLKSIQNPWILAKSADFAKVGYIGFRPLIKEGLFVFLNQRPIIYALVIKLNYFTDWLLVICLAAKLWSVKCRPSWCTYLLKKAEVCTQVCGYVSNGTDDFLKHYVCTAHTTLRIHELSFKVASSS